MSRLVGIDLGTTNSLVAIAEDGVPKILADAEGRKIVPSVTYFKEDGSVLVGDSALEKIIADPEHTIFSIKRFMGKGAGRHTGRSRSPAVQGLFREREHRPD